MRRIGFLSDLHWADPGATGTWHNPYDFGGVPARVRAALEWMADERVDLVAVTGDLCHHREPSAVAAVRETLSSASAPVRVVLGNHDDAGLAWPALAAAPEGVAGVRLCGVPVRNDSGWFAARIEPPPEIDATGDGEPLVVLSHFPLVSFAAQVAEQGFAYPGDGVGRAEVLAALRARRAASIVLSGHIHARATAIDGPVLQLVNGPLIEVPYEAAIVTIERSETGLDVHRESRGFTGPAPSRPFPELESEPAFSYRDGVWSVVCNRPAAPIAGGIS
jgi:3',5'-cyclic AMP phosphodiesterase CpdA